MLASIRSDAFQEYPGIQQTTFWLPDAEYSKLFKKFGAEESINKILQMAGEREERIALTRQVHGNSVRIVSSAGVAGEYDGLVTETPEMNLVIRTADCAAIMIYDPQERVIANLHAGWRGVYKNIIGNSIRLMKETWRSPLENLVVAVGPFIRSCCYQVGPEFRGYFPENYLQVREGKLYLDMDSAIRDQILGHGVREASLFVDDNCTCCSALRLPSHRRMKNKNRLFHMIKLKGE